jgi:hypothetical protein
MRGDGADVGGITARALEGLLIKGENASSLVE